MSAAHPQDAGVTLSKRGLCASEYYFLRGEAGAFRPPKPSQEVVRACFSFFLGVFMRQFIGEERQVGNVRKIHNYVG
jgi:hypothetical protein